jgi:hypothetical protein
MANARTDLGFGGELEAFDPKAWTPSRPRSNAEKPEKGATRQMAEAAGFKSREAQLPQISDQKIDRRRRTGRNAQFNLKAKPETIHAFCQIADQKGWGLGEAFEQAVLLLQREISRD